MSTAATTAARPGGTLASVPWGQLGPFIALALACVFFSITTDRFLSGQNLSLILQQVMVVGVIAIGQTLIILTAGIDLSCGVVMALGSIVMTKLAADLGLPTPLAVLAGIGVTAAFGLFNGLLVTRIKLPPFIVTLGTFNIAFAITQLYSESQTVTDIPDAMLWLGNTFAIGDTRIGYGVVLMIALYGGVWFWLRETAAGRHVYAVGNNPEATRLVGIPTERVLLGVYVLYRFADIAALHNDMEQLADGMQWAWLALVAYTWVGPVLFHRALKRELETVRLRKGF